MYILLHVIWEATGRKVRFYSCWPLESFIVEANASDLSPLRDTSQNGILMEFLLQDTAVQQKTPLIGQKRWYTSEWKPLRSGDMLSSKYIVDSSLGKSL